MPELVEEETEELAAVPTGHLINPHAGSASCCPPRGLCLSFFSSPPPPPPFFFGGGGGGQ